MKETIKWNEQTFDLENNKAVGKLEGEQYWEGWMRRGEEHKQLATWGCASREPMEAGAGLSTRLCIPVFSPARGMREFSEKERKNRDTLSLWKSIIKAFLGVKLHLFKSFYWIYNSISIVFVSKLPNTNYNVCFLFRLRVSIKAVLNYITWRHLFNCYLKWNKRTTWT